MATGAEAVTLLKQRCARFSGTSIDTYALQELQAAQVRLEHEPELPWFLLETTAWRYLEVGEDRVPVPDDFLMEYDSDALWVQQSGQTKRYELDKKHFDVLRNQYPVYGSRPQAYALVGSAFVVRPIIENMTANTWELRMMYYRSQDVIANDSTTNPWLTHFPDLVIAEAGLWIANNYLQNTTAAQKFQATIVEQKQKLELFNVARAEANQNYYDED